MEGNAWQTQERFVDFHLLLDVCVKLFVETEEGAYRALIMKMGEEND